MKPILNLWESWEKYGLGFAKGVSIKIQKECLLKIIKTKNMTTLKDRVRDIIIEILENHPPQAPERVGADEITDKVMEEVQRFLNVICE